MILVNDHSQTVLQRVLRERDIHEIGVTGIGARL